RRHVELLAGADLVIHDAQYTAEEYPAKIGWGHSPVEWTVDYAIAAGAKRLALYHHDPLRDDDAVERVVEGCRQRVRQAASTLMVEAAAEGMLIDLTEKGGSTLAVSTHHEQAVDGSQTRTTAAGLT